MTDAPDEKLAVDERLSRAYRDLASETTPATLNESVMRRAREVGGRGYAHRMHWLRPLAWAATVGLCLALVLELAELPAPDAVDLPSSLPEPAATGSGAKAEDSREEHRAVIQRPAGDSAQTREALMREKEAAVPEAVPARSHKFIAEDIAEAAACDGDEVASAEAWLECIRRLERDGRQAEAAAERTRLATAFPDFAPAVD